MAHITLGVRTAEDTVNRTAKDIDGSLAAAIGDTTASCGSFFFRVIRRVILGYPFVPDFFVNRIVLITHVGTGVRPSVRQLVKAVTASEELQDFVGTIHLHIGSWCRSSIATTIHLTYTGQSAAVDDDVGRFRGILTAFRLISSQVTTSIDCFDVKLLSVLVVFGADIVFVCILCSIDVYGDITLRRTVHIVTTEYLVDDKMHFHITLCGSCRTDTINVICAALTTSEHTAEVVILSSIFRINDLRSNSATIDIQCCVLGNNTYLAAAIDTALHGAACHVQFCLLTLAKFLP